MYSYDTTIWCRFPFLSSIVAIRKCFSSDGAREEEDWAGSLRCERSLQEPLTSGLMGFLSGAVSHRANSVAAAGIAFTAQRESGPKRLPSPSYGTLWAPAHRPAIKQSITASREAWNALQSRSSIHSRVGKWIQEAAWKQLWGSAELPLKALNSWFSIKSRSQNCCSNLNDNSISWCTIKFPVKPWEFF